MECKLALSVFRFDAKTDFLPYYKTHYVTVDLNKSVQTLLTLIQAQDPSFDFPKDALSALKINQKALFASETLKGVVESMGKELCLEPLSIKRAIKDMIIDTDDFYRNFDRLNAWVDGKDKALYEQYLIYRYASSALDVIEDFQGDALFAFAFDMIQKYPEQKEKILNVIADEKTGIFVRTRLCQKIYPCAGEVERKIAALKNTMMQHRPFFNPLVEKLSRRVDTL